MTPAELRAKLAQTLRFQLWLYAPMNADSGTCAVSALSDFLAENGLKIVPAEATKEMVDATRRAYSGLLREEVAKRLLAAGVAAFPDILKEPL